MCANLIVEGEVFLGEGAHVDFLVALILLKIMSLIIKYSVSLVFASMQEQAQIGWVGL